MERIIKYGIGEQDFRLLRERNCVYIDKTKYIDTIVRSGSKYYFLARPRRFGKSLFLSTLQYFFEGRRELFHGLYVDSTDWDWTKHAVLRLDLNMERYMEPGKLESVLNYYLRAWEEKYDVKDILDNPSQRFGNIIKAAHDKTGHEVVILVDEYDKPLVGNLNKNYNFEHYRGKLGALYSNFKSNAAHIRLVFLTGVSRFSKLSVFSDLNNLNDITFDNEFADICGITEKDLSDNFMQGIEKLAAINGLTYEEALLALKKNYDGYKFTEYGSDIYNPWSLLNCLEKSTIDNYWNETALPTVVAESLKRVNADLKKTFNTYCTQKDLKGMDLLNPNPTALLYQTGYLTIKEYRPKLRRYHLGIPNEEVKAGLFDFLLPYYVTCRRSTPNQVVSDIAMYFNAGEPQQAMEGIQTYFAGIDYKLKMDNENNFHNAFYLLMDLIGLETTAEAHTSDGSIDILIKTEDYIYVIELKYDHSAEDALRQIEEKEYARPYKRDIRRLFKIGVNFSSKTRCIESWKIIPD